MLTRMHIELACVHVYFTEKEVNETVKGISAVGKANNVTKTETEKIIESRENSHGRFPCADIQPIQAPRL